MKVQSINNKAPFFGALNITAEAKALIQRERGGEKKLAQYTKELANSRWDLNIEKCSWGDEIMPYFGNYRYCCVIPCRLQDEYVMVYSGEVGGDNEDDVVDCLKFSSSERAKEVYETLKSHFLTGGMPKTPLQHLDWDVYAMKALTEAELVPQTESPWAHFLKREDKPKHIERFETNAENKAEKPSFFKRLSAAWDVLLGK